MKTRLQKTRESLQEYASEVERLANLAFFDHPAIYCARNNIFTVFRGWPEGGRNLDGCKNSVAVEILNLPCYNRNVKKTSQRTLSEVADQLGRSLHSPEKTELRSGADTEITTRKTEGGDLVDRCDSQGDTDAVWIEKPFNRTRKKNKLLLIT
ncbi:hypothetical protein TNCV_31491 [Trichonephila clavipes]|nr:hypothetical protein TNCV_31491 [Trichonephila clavipes]